MNIVLDTNIIFQDPRMSGPNFQILLELLKQKEIKIYLPQVVVDEVINKFKNKIQSIHDTIDKEINALQRLMADSIDPVLDEDTIDLGVQEYVDYLNSVINEYGIHIIPYPDIPHEKVAKRAMEKLKPFSNSGAGYRDCLIWESIKTLLSLEDKVLVLPEIIFISANYKDFGVSEIDIHPDLKKQLFEEGYHQDSIGLFPSLKEFIEKRIKINLAHENRIKEIVQNNESEDFDLRSEIRESLNKDFINMEIDSYSIGLPSEFEDLTVQSYSEEFEIHDFSVKRISAEKFVFDIAISSEVYFDLFIFKMDYWAMNDEEKPSIWESDWNDHYMWAQTESEVEIDISIITDQNLNTISHQINDVSYHHVE